MSDRPRVIVALQDGIECAAVADWLTGEGLEPIMRPTLRTAAEEMDARAFDLLVADAQFVFRDRLCLGKRVRSTRTPIVAIGTAAEEPREDAVSALAMYVTRPLERGTFICFVSMALLEGRPARCSARKPVNHVEVFMNGLPVRLIDVSNEGLRLELPPAWTRRSLPASFAVRIPFVGVNITVQRKWSRPAGTATSTAWCGGALSQNRSIAEQAWRSFVETVPAIQETRPPAR
jgi:hypothetical protein